MKKDARNVGLALIVGLAAGYAMGVLTAPKSGEETRKDLKDAGSKAYKKAETHLKSAYAELNETIAKATKQASKLSAKSREQLDGLLAAAHTAQGQVKQLMSKVHRGEASEDDFEEAVVAARVAKDELQDFIDKK